MSPTSTPLHIPLKDEQRQACEIVPAPSKAEVIAESRKRPEDIQGYIWTREAAHNGALGQCNLRGVALVKAIDAANVQLNKLAEK